MSQPSGLERLLAPSTTGGRTFNFSKIVTTVRETLRQALESENFEVIFATDGNEALEKFYEGYIDIVLLDLKMPGKSGWEVFERMTAVNPLLAVIIITARNGAVELAAEAGATAIMEKPLDLPTLLWTINRLLREPIVRRLWRIAAHCPLIMVSDGCRRAFPGLRFDSG